MSVCITSESTDFEITEQMTKYIAQQYAFTIMADDDDEDNDPCKSIEDARLSAKMVKVFLAKAIDSGMCSEETKNFCIEMINRELQAWWGINFEDC